MDAKNKLNAKKAIKLLFIIYAKIIMRTINGSMSYSFTPDTLTLQPTINSLEFGFLFRKIDLKK